jgi:transposase
MIAFNRRTKIFVCKEATDMRASYDSLFSRVKAVLQQDPFSGHLFLFVNTRRTSCKCLYYDGTGLVIIMKRLEAGTFSRINPYYRGELALTQAEFGLFFEGADLEKRFLDSPREIKKYSAPVEINCNQATTTPISIAGDSRKFIRSRSQSPVGSAEQGGAHRVSRGPAEGHRELSPG